jgi:predicted ATPase
MEKALQKLTIRGLKSIRELENFEIRNLNVFIGANGTGKSNFISFFMMLQSIMDGNHTDYVKDNGGISDILYNGPKNTEKMEFEVCFGRQIRRFSIRPTVKDEAVLSEEACFDEPDESGLIMTISTSNRLKLGGSNDNSSHPIKETKNEVDHIGVTGVKVHAKKNDVMTWKIYHFHDTSSYAPMRGYEIIEDNITLRDNASNIAPFLLRLREDYNVEYQEIVSVCRLVMPYLKDFLLNMQVSGKSKEIKKVNLSWRTKRSDYPMQPYHLSDGSIRFICLVTALLQPNPPTILIFDEPELGLHPEAIRLIGELINSAAKRTQIIVATQSPLLIDQFEIEDIVVVNRKDDQSVFERFNKENFDKWLEDYSTGELWVKNVLQGGVGYE